ncbi:electron transport complex protein RnfC [Sedimentibacter acidaminivorans]|jgi:H+/Na+-translocating ferredoxin:NAD+ oxidoreductase subunit C|uniref:Ion-translocating oxidoreductase complex subunit C n=1 Tax=Sedimentibacter acidaminivorans TaxID=913099 RepID=A0ABS4GB53_9FIRM|nr:electron transport complex subunit RsxC [Sedimentibacter acidaminivorans]MBP1924914.1 electron transport complex protein RnfC [Sedimentibacter acidaminivorans]
MSTKGFTFKGGIHPPHNKKQTQSMPIENAVEPKYVVIPLSQHIGAPCEPLVVAGDKVKVGQKIGESKAFVSAPVHSSVSGTVKRIEQHQTTGGAKVNSIVIESDGLLEVHESVKPKGNVEDLSKEEVLAIIKDAGLTGMGGAGFPTHVKLSPPKDKVIDTIIVNGAECEPFLTADHRIMLEKPEDVLMGAKAVMKAVGVDKCYIAIEKNKPDAIEVMQKIVKDADGIEVAPLETKYPQGDEKRIINAITGREVPSGGLPMDVGCVVDNVGTIATIGNVFRTGMPVIQRVTTITGSAIKNPKNLYIRIGTLFSDIIEQCGGFSEEPGKIINGGPMMGIAQYTTDVPAIKGTSGILILNKKDATLQEPSNCIRCGKCVSACPVNLQPFLLSRLSIIKQFDEAEKNYAADCIECGSCSFICPAKRPLVDTIRIAKKEVLAKRRKAVK